MEWDSACRGTRRADDARHSGRQLRLSRRIGQVSGVLHRLAPTGAGCRPRLAGRGGVLHELRLSARVLLRQPLRGRLVTRPAALHRAHAERRAPSPRAPTAPSSCTASPSTSPTWKSARTACSISRPEAATPRAASGACATRARCRRLPTWPACWPSSASRSRFELGLGRDREGEGEHGHVVRHRASSGSRATRRPRASDRARAIYEMQRHGAAPSPALLTALIKDRDAGVRAAVVYVAGVRGGFASADAKAQAAVAAIGLKDADPVVRRRSAEALVRIGQAPDKPSLAPAADIYALLNEPDRFVRWAGRTRWNAPRAPTGRIAPRRRRTCSAPSSR